MLNAKPKSFSRVERMIFDMMPNPIAPIGAGLVRSLATERVACSKDEIGTMRTSVLDTELALV